MKTIRTAEESRLTYTANGIKGKNGEIISTFGDCAYLPAYYDFDPVRLEIRLTIKEYKELRIIPHGCNVRNDSDYMTDYYDKDRLTIPATAGAEFLAAAIGYKKNIETKRRKGEKCDHYKREAEQADRNADALKLAEQIASGELDNGAEIIAERIQAEQERRERARLEENKTFAAELLKEGNRNGQTVVQVGDVVIYRKAQRMRIFDGSTGVMPGQWDRVETLETVIAINIKTGEREQVTDVPLAEAYEFYKRVAA